MRFLQDGPSIPDDLLTARDEGRVVFFCGAGVSRARAGLADFFGLAGDVITKLGVPADNPAFKILEEARHIDERTGVSGLISVDRIFGLLERDFLTRDIELAVAQVLQPPSGVDLSAHRVLLDLASTQEGKVRLVTTNFDRLFEDCNNAIQCWQPPRLPDPSRQDEMDGIVYLHGRMNDDYSGSKGDGFILSSSDFGRAYLSDGWATEFFRQIIDRYVVVFVGYGADDPPVRYLLEALSAKAGQLSGVYAFQSGTSSESAARWRHKGVEAIAYAAENGHQALWDTLEAWAERAKSPDGWYDAVIDLARKGPEHLQPHERGQVTHVVSTFEGARKFYEGDTPPPADWLCVFDPYRRHAMPGRIGALGAQGPFIDPFDLYGLDFDVAPNKVDPENLYGKRDIPPNAWDGFAANRLDRRNLGDDNFSAIRGHRATNYPQLPSRLGQMGVWISKVAHQPASVWWATYQGAIHPDIQQRIRWELERLPKDVSPVMRRAWRYLFESWEAKGKDSHSDWHDLKAVIDKDGWDRAAVRKYVAIDRPYIKADRNYSGGPKPPEWKGDIRIRDLLNLGVEYPDALNYMDIPDEWLGLATCELRKNLEHALHLETELGLENGLGDFALKRIRSIIPDDDPSIDQHGRAHGLSGAIIGFSSLFERLIEMDVDAARREFAFWPVNDDTIFSRLRIWACGKTELLPEADVGSLIVGLSDDAFWSAYHQRDLLLVLARRWQGLTDGARKEIENRLLEGPPRWKDAENAKFEERQAWASLSRIVWLANNGCEFTFDLGAETERLRAQAPEWKLEYAAKTAESMGPRGGRVRTETEHSSLLEEPLGSTLLKALELSGAGEEFLIKKDPFAGLSAEHPVRAFAALANAAERGEYPEWAWHTFLNFEARKNDKPKFIALIAERISLYPDKAVTEFIRPASDWLTSVSKTLATRFPPTFDKVMAKFINVLRQQPPASGSAVVRGNKEPEWVMEAINAPVGKIAQALFNDPRKDGLKAGEGYPAEWLAYVNELLSLPGDLRRHALVIFAHNLNWFYTIDPHWAESSLLSVLDGDVPDDRNAVWSGFFWGGTIPGPELYVRIKPHLLMFAKERSLSRRDYGEVLIAIILAGWGSLDEETKERFISNDEMRDVLLHADDDFRSRILWQAERWSEDKAERDGEKWSEMLPELLRDIWPRQKSARTPTISVRLCELAFSNAERFPEMAEIILPLLTVIDRDHLMLPNLRKSKGTIVDLYPDQTLAILHAVLPDNVAAWPYDIEATLQRIGEADAKLKRDERLLELNRKWNSR